VSGVTFSIPGAPPLIVVNQTQPSDCMRFTLCHELAHVIMHRFPTPNMEEEADAFASAFLVPTEDFKPYVAGRKVDLRLLAALKPEWRVSMAALVFAARRAGAINDTQAATFGSSLRFKRSGSASRLNSTSPPRRRTR
jgi:Zn-dependent peptidase ImmA (M78 family)